MALEDNGIPFSVAEAKRDRDSLLTSYKQFIDAEIAYLKTLKGGDKYRADEVLSRAYIDTAIDELTKLSRRLEKPNGYFWTFKIESTADFDNLVTKIRAEINDGLSSSTALRSVRDYITTGTQLSLSNKASNLKKVELDVLDSDGDGSDKDLVASGTYAGVSGAPPEKVLIHSEEVEAIARAILGNDRYDASGISTSDINGWVFEMNNSDNKYNTLELAAKFIASKMELKGIDVNLDDKYGTEEAANFVYVNGWDPIKKDTPPAGSTGASSSSSHPYRLVKGMGPALANDKLRGNGNAVFIVSDSGELFHVTENLAKELDANGWWYPPEELPQDQIDAMTLRTSLNYTAELGILEIKPVGEYLLIRGNSNTPLGVTQLRGNSDAVFAVDKNGNMFHVTAQVAEQMVANNTWMTPAIINQKTVDDTPITGALASATGGTAQLTVPPTASTVASSASPAGPATSPASSSGTPPSNTGSPATSAVNADNRQKVNDMFNQFAGRVATEAEVAQFGALLQNGTAITTVSGQISALPESAAYRQNLVWKTYNSFVVREPSQEEYEYWSSRLASGEFTPEQFRLHVVNDTEPRANQEYVWSVIPPEQQQAYTDAINKMYQDAVKRDATTEEIHMHATALHNGVVSLNELANDIRWSPEGRKANGDYVPPSFTAAPVVSSSSASPAPTPSSGAGSGASPSTGTASGSGTPPSNSGSPTSVTASSENKQRISDLFDQYVGRPANETELANYATALQGGKSLATIRSEVAALPEAANYRQTLIWETYRAFVVREPTQEEFNIWHGELASGNVTPEGFRIHIANAPEATDNQKSVWENIPFDQQQSYREAVNKVYQDNVGRPATEEEVRMHGVALANRIITLEGLANDVRWSPEGRKFNGDDVPEYFAAPPATFTTPESGIATAENKQRISDLFDQYVGRPANENELNIYGTSLQNGKDMELIRREVANLPDAINYRQTLIWETYGAFVSREPSAEEFAIWHEKLASGEYTPEQFRIHVANDTESVSNQTYVWSSLTPAAQAMYAEAINKIYRENLGRDASQEEIRIHGVALANKVYTLDGLTNDVYWSPEARTFRGEYTPEYFASSPVVATPTTNTPATPDPVSVYGEQVKQYINQYVGVDASAADINAWSQRAANGEDIRAGIAATPEAVNYRQSLISETYRLFVVRDPAQAEFDYWHDMLTRGQYTPQQFRIHIVNDTEPKAAQAYVWSTLSPTAQAMYSEAINNIFVNVAGRPATQADIQAHVPGLVYGLTNLTKLEQNIAADVNSGGRKIPVGQVLGATTSVSNVMSISQSMQSQEKKPEILGEASNSSDDGAVWVTDASGERRDISGLSWEKRAEVQKHIVEGGGTFSQLDQVSNIYASGDPAAIDNWERFSQTGKYSPDTPWGATYQSVVKDGYSHELASAWADGTHADNMQQATTPVNGVVGTAGVSTSGPNMFGVN